MVIFQSILGFILAIGILTTIHELGHFLVARWCGVKILRFSIGFGKPIFSCYDKLGIEYVISMIPLGGYIKMLGEYNNNLDPQEQHMALHNKTIPARMAIFAAGPLANLLFALITFWLVWVIGFTAVAPIIGNVPHGSAAHLAGLKTLDEIVAVNNKTVVIWSDVTRQLLNSPDITAGITITIKDSKNIVKNHHALNAVNLDATDVLASLGLEPYDPIVPEVGEILPHSAASSSDLREGDIILAADSIKITTRTALSNYLRSKPRQLVMLDIKRGNKTNIKIFITPVAKLLDGGAEVGFIGIRYASKTWPKELLRTKRLGPVAALSAASQDLHTTIILATSILKKMLFQEISMHSIGGPIAIAKHAGMSVNAGISYFLHFLAWTSVSLGILNLLPIPFLDGGNLLYCLMEAILGKKITDRCRPIGAKIGITLLIFLTCLAFYNDLLRW